MSTATCKPIPSLSLLITPDYFCHSSPYQETMEVVADALLSASLELVFEKLSSANVLKFARLEHIQSQLKIWERKLLEISEVLNDAEERQIPYLSVKECLSDLRDLVYDMEDVLDEFSYEGLRTRLETESSTSSKVRNIIPTCCAPVQAIRNVKMGSKIKDLNMQLDDIYARKADLRLDKVAAITHSTWERPLTTSSLVHEPGVFGRDADKQNIMDMLLKDDENTDNVSVVSIVAMGGAGKTTLASLVYNDYSISQHFYLKAWACVSDPFDVVRVSNTILTDITYGRRNDSYELNQIQIKLRDALMGRRFLLVLDDVWTENYSDWEYFRSPLCSGARGSKILITTRNKNVAMMMGGGTNCYELQHLSDYDCWSVFLRHAFGNNDINEYPELEPIGRGIASRCGGLPLAACALGGLLRVERREDKWNAILNSPISYLISDILPALKLSYNVLPSPLKRCFVYCAIFPKDYAFDKEELIRMWIAEGFIPQRNEIEVEDLGDNYFQELLARSFFQPSVSEKSSFVMNVMMNDLAKFIAKEICFSLEENLGKSEQQIISRKFHHLPLIRCEYDVFKKFKDLHGINEHLRTFLTLSIGAPLGSSWLSKEVLEASVLKFKCLRVLLLNSYEILDIPDSIGDLKHLRYLNLSKTRLKQLPESIGKLYMLQTLIVSMCSNLTRLPLSIQNLNSLRYLDVTGTPLEEMPPQMSKLKSLQMLSTFVVGKKNSSIKELRNISNHRGSLHISNLENVIHVRDARAASVITQKLKNLRLSWNDSENAGTQLEVLDALEPHLGLIELQIEGYGGPEFPPWLKDSKFYKMVVIKLVNCRNCKFLPRLGQFPELKHLEIQGMDEVKSVGEEFYGTSAPFLKLESLTFSNMPQWEDWECPSSLSYPHLLRLTMIDCPNLIKDLPAYLPSLVDLEIGRCPSLKLLSGGMMMQTPHDYTTSSNDGGKPSLKVLKIRECSSLKSLSAGKFPSTLKELSIGGCNQLESISEMFDDNNSLKVLDIGKYPSLRVIPDCLYNLEALYVGNCENLERLPSQLQNLRVLSICKCHKLEGLSDQMQNLLDLRIADCMKLKGLPHQMQNLRELRIEDCPEVGLEPQGLTALTSLKIESSRIRLQGLNELLPSLEELTIDGKNSEITSFSDGPLLLPTTLTSLTIYDFKNLISLDSLSLQTLTSLQGLYIHDCPKLESFCPKEGLPDTLSRLDIRGCPVLEERCSKEIGQDWARISHIPHVLIGDHDVFQQ